MSIIRVIKKINTKKEAKLPIVAMSVCLLVVTLSACYSNNATDSSNTIDNENNASNNISNNKNSGQIPSKTANIDSVKVITPDWGIAAELTAMGHPPVATGDKRMYADWVGQSLPTETKDLGIRYQPNPEMMAQLDVDLVIDNFFYQHIRSMYGDVPVKSLLFKSETNKDSEYRTAVWQDYAELTLKLGDMIQQPADAKAYVVDSEQRLKSLGKVFRKKYPQIRKLAIVQFSDIANLRMYASNSLYQPTFEKMGLEIVTFDKGNDWGFVRIQLGDLEKIDSDTCLIIVKPFSDMLQTELNNSALWQKMDFGGTSKSSRCMTITDPVWMYGGIASMTSFAEKLINAELHGGHAVNHFNHDITVGRNK